MNIKKLVSSIVSEGKMSSDEIIALLSEGMDHEPAEVFMELYRKAYGHHLSRETASEWVESIGETWTMEQTTEVGNSNGIDWNRINRHEFYAVMNAFHEKFGLTAKSFGLEDSAEFYAGLVRDYFRDEEEATVFDYYFSHAA